ncbi:MAG: hypothetical protein CM1200mP13_15500 [Candidatus Pelagibacterales bacterium]|nr:MAG: hypothetical protein CM1200mP13_15500 [Pelagibacterales bacterium]
MVCKNILQMFLLYVLQTLLGVMVMAFQKNSSLPTNKVVGMAGILDRQDLNYFCLKN